MGKGKQLFPLWTNPGRYTSRMSERGKLIWEINSTPEYGLVLHIWKTKGWYQMKIRRRALIVVLCVLLVFSFSAVVYASASKTFFSRPSGSHRCSGRGTIDGTRASGTFQAVPIPGLPIQPDEAYSSKVTLYAHSASGELIGMSMDTGDTSAYTMYSGNNKISAIWCYFTFNGTNFGGYRLSIDWFHNAKVYKNRYFFAVIHMFGWDWVCPGG